MLGTGSNQQKNVDCSFDDQPESFDEDPDPHEDERGRRKLKQLFQSKIELSTTLENIDFDIRSMIDKAVPRTSADSPYQATVQMPLI